MKSTTRNNTKPQEIINEINEPCEKQTASREAFVFIEILACVNGQMSPYEAYKIKTNATYFHLTLKS